MKLWIVDMELQSIQAEIAEFTALVAESPSFF